MACTTVLVGKKANISGSTIIARDCDAEVCNVPVKFVVVPAKSEKQTFHSYVTGLDIPLPENALRYQMAPFVDYKIHGQFGECGINSENVAMSATESLYGNPQVLGLDPLVSNGIGEDALLSIVLPFIHSARDGVQYLGKLIEKYGLVPNELMPETTPAWNTTEINQMYNRKLDKDAMKLRDLVNNNASDTKIKSVIRQLNQENYRVLSICFGTPPEKFTYEYRDKNKKYHTTGEVTPLEFYKKFADINLDDYVELMNLPGGGYKYNQTYGIELCNNVVGGRNIRYLNVPMHDMRRMVIDQLKDDEPVWFACDVLQEWNNPAGLLSLKVYDWKLSFGISLGKDKATRVQYRESMPTHAMLICGVDLHDNEPTKWKVQNSWGDKPGHKGYFIMDNSWMDQYTYNTVVNKKYLTDTERAAYEKAEINLPYWTAMLSD